MADSKGLTEEIDADEGLKSKRKLLTIASLTLLALSFSGAKIEEANSFIFKIKFAHQNGLAILLVISIIFLMVRYYNYAKKYHDRLYDIWANRLISRSFFYEVNPHDNNEDAGLVADSRSDELDDIVMNRMQYHWSYSYRSSFLFRRFIIHYWGKEEYGDDDRVEEINIFSKFGSGIYFKTLFFEAREQFKSFFTHRENLDILAPYFIGCAAIASYYFNAELQDLLNLISTNTKK